MAAGTGSGRRYYSNSSLFTCYYSRAADFLWVFTVVAERQEVQDWKLVQLNGTGFGHAVERLWAFRPCLWPYPEPKILALDGEDTFWPSIRLYLKPEILALNEGNILTLGVVKWTVRLYLRFYPKPEILILTDGNILTLSAVLFQAQARQLTCLTWKGRFGLLYDFIPSPRA